MTTSELQTVSDHRFGEVLADLYQRVDGAVLVSQDRCVDALLDLYNAASNDVIRLVVADIIDDVRHISAIKASELHDRLDEVTAAVAVESAFFAPTDQPASA